MSSQTKTQLEFEKRRSDALLDQHNEALRRVQRRIDAIRTLESEAIAKAIEYAEKQAAGQPDVELYKQVDLLAKKLGAIIL